MTGIHSEKCIIKQLVHCVNITEYTSTVMVRHTALRDYMAQPTAPGLKSHTACHILNTIGSFNTMVKYVSKQNRSMNGTCRPGSSLGESANEWWVDGKAWTWPCATEDFIDTLPQAIPLFPSHRLRNRTYSVVFLKQRCGLDGLGMWRRNWLGRNRSPLQWVPAGSQKPEWRANRTERLAWPCAFACWSNDQTMEFHGIHKEKEGV